MKNLLAVFALTFASFTLQAQPQSDPPDRLLKVVAAMPVLHDGRVMPLDSFARLHLMQFSGKRTIQDQSALEWMMDLLLAPEKTRAQPLFLINNHEVLEAMGVPVTETISGEGKPSTRRFSFNHLLPGMQQLETLARQADQMDPADRGPVETEMIRLFTNVYTYRTLGLAFAYLRPFPALHIEDMPLKEALGLDPREEDFAYFDLRPLADQIYGRLPQLQTPEALEDLSDAEMTFVLSMHEFWRRNLRMPFQVLPAAPHGEPVWLAPFDALYQDQRDTELSAAAARLAAFGRAWRAGDWDAAERAYREVNEFVQGRMRHVRDVGLAMSEARFNRADFFGKAKSLYFIGFLLAFAALITGKSQFRLLAWLPIGVATLWHIIGLSWRVYLTARPPVTNLYGTFLFVGLVCLLLAFLIEAFQKNGLGLFAGSFIALTFLFLADRFAVEGDTLGKVVAVLASNFWLSTHVIAVTTGYAGVWIAGVFGHIWLVMKLMNRPEDKLRPVMSALDGLLGFGLTFAFLGTMLGGVWADQSWGRFWGWDPKENGALLIVLWSAVIYHARIAGMIREVGTAAMAVLGCVMVMLAWLGINLLGVGLHSYGFTNKMAVGFYTYVAAELIFLGVTVGFLMIRERAERTVPDKTGRAEAETAEGAESEERSGEGRSGEEPMGLQILSGLLTLFGAMGVFAFFSLYIFSSSASLSAALTRLGISPFLLAGSMLVVFSAALAAGIGLHKKTAWGWSLALFTMLFNLFMKVLSVAKMGIELTRLPREVFEITYGEPGSFLLQKGVNALISLIVVVYLLRKPIRERFGIDDQSFTKRLLVISGLAFSLPVFFTMLHLIG
ncbi:MAG: cytochrome c biogenesis protein CcsA [Verrucomicrobia bacterium]|nr:cytochrome c biogenesis protein CcsA [Verrucomicrobiota bacterium]MCH8528336.1 cytochrome c biogenesis protein CcsA [Kiritimatiellia bacterium]